MDQLQVLGQLYWTSASEALYYENTPMQYREKFLVVKMKKFTGNFFNIFLIYAQNIDCG